MVQGRLNCVIKNRSSSFRSLLICSSTQKIWPNCTYISAARPSIAIVDSVIGSLGNLSFSLRPVALRHPISRALPFRIYFS